MKTLFFLIAPLIALLVLSGCDKQPPLVPEQQTSSHANPAQDAEQVALEFIAQAGWASENNDGGIAKLEIQQSLGIVTGFRRQPITEDVAHYSIRVRVGAGPYNTIGIHRVVKERRPFVPIRTADAVFFQHGSFWGFEENFLPGIFSDSRPDDFGAAGYLAENNVDVWGIDQAWALVPEGVTNFEFMREWGLQKNLDDLSFGLAVARLVRFLTGIGYDQLILSGYSSGVATCVALLNQETQLPHGHRNVRGFIPVDYGIKLPSSPTRDWLLADAEFVQGLYDSGQYQCDVSWLDLLGQLAETEPDGESPIIPGLTNLQAALFIGAGQIGGPDVTFHFVAGVLDDTGFPIDFQLMTIQQWVDFLQSSVPFEPTLFIAESEALTTDGWPLPFNDHFSEITVPVFNVAAKGGFRELTEYGTTFLGSTDVTHHIVEIPSPDILTEFGHIDLLAGDNAMTKVWQPMLEWIREHRTLSPEKIAEGNTFQN